MEEQGFWQDNESYMNLVMNKWNMLADDTYIYVVHLEQKRAWFSETTRTYFGIKDAYVPDHYEVMRRLIHPDDFWEYEEGIPERVRGINLRRGLGEGCVRGISYVQHSHGYCGGQSECARAPDNSFA